IFESLLSHKPYMSPLTTISSTGSTTSMLEEKSISSSSSCSSSVSQISGEVSRKRKPSDAMETIILNQKLSEEAKDRRHKERMEMGMKLLEKLNKLI
ncbi:PREDICTED: uncharacterized protein LOC105461551, partial [Wasmannia auropunctata]|uniref:uncharacterized protein LOC105461551 n=1 Tax=Wasmannia auropunctata TaxID=64793 RepID=UPI0005ED5EDA